MPNAHFKEFTGLSPRIRGESSNASECVNVDLYGRTIRPFPEDDIIEAPNRDGRFVRIEGNVHFIQDAINIRLQSFKGYYVVLYQTSQNGKWFKKVFKDPSGAGAITTPVSFEPPVIIGENAVSSEIDLNSVYFTGLQTGIQLSRYAQPSLFETRPARPFNEGVYTYSLEVVDSRGKIIHRTPEWDVTFEYENKTIDIIQDSPSTLPSYKDANSVTVLYGYNGSKDDFTKNYGFQDPTYTSPVTYVTTGARDTRGLSRGRVFQTQVGIDPATISIASEGTTTADLLKIPRWVYPVEKRSIKSPMHLTANSLASLKRKIVLGDGEIKEEGGDTDATGDVESSFYNFILSNKAKTFGNPNAQISANREISLSTKKFTLSGYGIDQNDNLINFGEKDPNGLKGKHLYWQSFEESDVFPYVYGVTCEAPSHLSDTEVKDLTYRLYRRSDTDTGTYKVAEGKTVLGGRTIVLVDPNAAVGSEKVEKIVSKNKYRYVTTLSRLAGRATGLDDWNEESGPSEELVIEGYAPNAVLSRPTPPSSVQQITIQRGKFVQNPTSNVVSQDLQFDAWNIYRLTEGEDGTTQFQLVEQVASTEQSYIDRKDESELGETPESLFLDEEIPFQYEGMPSGLNLATAPYNGMQVGWKGGSVYWTDQYYMSGWSPSTFNVELPHNIVNIVPYGNAMAVVTTDGVYRAVMSGPTEFNFVESPSGEGGIKGLTETVIGSDKGVIYLSDSGIHIFDGVRSQSMTDNAVGEEYFRSDLYLTGAILRENDGIIHLFHNGGVLIFDTRSSQISSLGNITAKEVFRDHASGSLLYLNSVNQIYELFSNRIRKRHMLYRTGEIHFGMNGRKRAKYIQFLGSGKVQCVPFINGSSTGLKGKTINMDGMENDTRIYLPSTALLDSLEIEISGTGEVEEFLIMWERV